MGISGISSQQSVAEMFLFYVCRSIRQIMPSCGFVSAIGLPDTPFEFPRSRSAAKNRTPLSPCSVICELATNPPAKRPYFHSTCIKG